MRTTSTHAPAERPSARSGARRLLGVSGALALAVLAAAPAPAEARIVEGRGVAGVQLGETKARVRAVLGAPERGSTVLNYRYLRRHGLGVYFIGGRVFEITVLRRPQATATGIRIGSTRAALTAAYPRIACRRAVVGRDAFECRLSGRHRRRATETLFTTKADRVVSIAVHFA